MRKWLPAIALVCAAAIGAYFYARSPRTSPDREISAPVETEHAPTSPPPVAPTPVAETSASTAAPTAIATVVSAPTVAANEPVYPPVMLPEPTSPEEIQNLPQSTVLENVRSVFHQYNSKFGGNPVGTNPEITRVLNGENLRQIRFLRPEDGIRVNGKGELIDNWGTPYFFHQLSGTEMEIHSAGPDKKMWTPDDLVIR